MKFNILLYSSIRCSTHTGIKKKPHTFSNPQNVYARRLRHHRRFSVKEEFKIEEKENSLLRPKDETSDERRKKQRSVFHHICTSVHYWIVCECVCHCVSCFTFAFTSNVAVLPFRDLYHVQRVDHLGNLDWDQVEE